MHRAVPGIAVKTPFSAMAHRGLTLDLTQWINLLSKHPSIQAQASVPFRIAGTTQMPRVEAGVQGERSQS